MISCANKTERCVNCHDFYEELRPSVKEVIVTHHFKKDAPENVTAISINRAMEIIKLNKEGKQPEKLSDSGLSDDQKFDYGDIVGQESITRFDKKKKKRKKRRRDKNRNMNDKKND